MLHRRTLLAFALTLAAGRVAAAEPPLAPDMQRVIDRGRLVVAVASTEIPPFVAADADGRLTGRDIEIAQGMASALGVGVEFERTARDAEEIIDRVARHAVDLGISRLSVTLERAKRARFSRPYLTLHRALLLSRPRWAQLEASADPLARLNTPGAVIAVLEGSGHVPDAKAALPSASLRLYPRWRPDMLDAVRQGEVLAAYQDELEIARAMASEPAAPLQFRAVILNETRDPIAVALPWDSLQLLAWVDLYLESAVGPLSVEQFLARDHRRD
jgi:polar amino acid transport system substrate-binding protein